MTILEGSGLNKEDFFGGGNLPSVKICIKRLKAHKLKHGKMPSKPKEGEEIDRDRDGHSFWALRQKVKRAIKAEAKEGGEE